MINANVLTIKKNSLIFRFTKVQNMQSSDKKSVVYSYVKLKKNVTIENPLVTPFTLSDIDAINVTLVVSDIHQYTKEDLYHLSDA